MGSPLFGLSEELELENSLIELVKIFEGKVFIIANVLIFLLKVFNIITFYQFFSLFICYVFWLNCSVMYNRYNRYNYYRNEKKISKMD